MLLPACYTEVINVGGRLVVDWWPCMSEGAFRCSLYLSPNVLDAPNVFFIAIQPIKFEQVHSLMAI